MNTHSTVHFLECFVTACVSPRATSPSHNKGVLKGWFQVRHMSCDNLFDPPFFFVCACQWVHRGWNERLQKVVSSSHLEVDDDTVNIDASRDNNFDDELRIRDMLGKKKSSVSQIVLPSLSFFW